MFAWFSFKEPHIRPHTQTRLSGPPAWFEHFWWDYGTDWQPSGCVSGHRVGRHIAMPADGSARRNETCRDTCKPFPAHSRLRRALGRSRKRRSHFAARSRYSSASANLPRAEGRTAASVMRQIAEWERCPRFLLAGLCLDANERFVVVRCQSGGCHASRLNGCVQHHLLRSRLSGWLR